MKKTILLVLTLPLFFSAQVPSLLKDISPGTTSTSFSDITTLQGDNILFLTQSTVSASSGLWVSDGSTAGTKQLRNLQAKSDFGELNGERFFGAVATNSVFYLWETNGTYSGTDSIPLSDIVDITTLHTVGNKLVFFGLNSGGNTEVWTTDGTAAGTHSMLSLVSDRPVKEINSDQDEKVIDVSDLEPGVYLVNIETEKMTVTKKLIKQ